MTRSPDQTGSIYFVAPVGGGPIKIGFSTNVESRLQKLRGQSPVQLETMAIVPGTGFDERAIQNHFISARSHGEWFHPVPELVALVAEIVGQGTVPDRLRGNGDTPCLTLRRQEAA